MAELMPSLAEKIEAYRKLLAYYPASEVGKYNLAVLEHEADDEQPERRRKMMERKHLHGITLLGGLAMALLCGCIRDELEPCPPLRLSLEVADKNYVNSAAAARLGYEEERPEDLPFREYVSDLAYRVSDLETGRVVAERTLSPVEGDAGSVEVPLPADLPYGSYVLTAWGNLGDTAAFDSDLASLGLHPGGAEGSDAYFTRDTLVYALDSERFSCGMRRLKGKLILATERMPRRMPSASGRYRIS